jgi:2-polyprenyl-3-methyl-5-hydroxy-6-metoxy-1,4-benzoquinol methylase
MIQTDYSAIYSPDTDFDQYYTKATAKRITPYIKKDQKVLELGSATGLMTQCLQSCDAYFTCVERAEAYQAIAKERSLEKVGFLQNTFENLSLEDRFDHILMTNVLHEVPHPKELLTKLKSILSAKGMIHITLQNPQSLHRLIAQKAGLLEDLTEISVRGKQYQTERLYHADELIELFSYLGYSLQHREGIFLKPLTNAMMEKLEPNVIEAFDLISPLFSDYCAINYFTFIKDTP